MNHHEPSLRSGSGDAVFYRSLHLDSGTNSVAGGRFRKLNSRPLTFTLGLLNETSTEVPSQRILSLKVVVLVPRALAERHDDGGGEG